MNLRHGFTLLEVMVASLLLGILVTALTMVFNQSSVAWRVGMAGVVNLNNTRSDLGKKHDNYDNILPGLTTDKVTKKEYMMYRAVSLWKNGQLRTDRAFDSVTESLSYSDAKTAKAQRISSASAGQSARTGPTGGLAPPTTSPPIRRGCR